MSILDTVIGQCRRQGYQRIDAVRVRIGRAAGILPDALSFAFDCAKAGTIAAGAELIIDHLPVGGFCNDCGRPFELSEEDRFVFCCPACNSSAIRVEQGQEMQIADMDVE